LGSRARALLLLPCFAFAVGVALHLIGRIVVREKTCVGPGVHCGLQIVTYRGGAPDEDQRPRNHPGRFPNESDIDAVLEEFGNDPRAAIRALLCDLEALPRIMRPPFRERLQLKIALTSWFASDPPQSFNPRVSDGRSWPKAARLLPGKRRTKLPVDFAIVQAPSPRCPGVIRPIERLGLDLASRGCSRQVQRR
jgi:hypothetical protein